VEPAEFWAVHVYSPTCSACAESMLKVLIFLLIFKMAMFPSLVNVLLLCDQEICTGRSPLLIVQVKEVESPVFMVSSPKLNGKICGTTGKQFGILRWIKRKRKLQNIKKYRSRVIQLNMKISQLCFLPRTCTFLHVQLERSQY
jgi:hypothetical protein